MKSIMLAIVIGIATAATANAAMFNLLGDNLLTSCQSSDKSEQALCLTYIMGASTGADVTLQIFAPDKAKACVPPPGFRPEQLRDAVVRHLQKHPADKSAVAALSVILAERELWRCK